MTSIEKLALYCRLTADSDGYIVSVEDSDDAVCEKALTIVEAQEFLLHAGWHLAPGTFKTHAARVDELDRMAEHSGEFDPAMLSRDRLFVGFCWLRKPWLLVDFIEGNLSIRPSYLPVISWAAKLLHDLANQQASGHRELREMISTAFHHPEELEPPTSGPLKGPIRALRAASLIHRGLKDGPEMYALQQFCESVVAYFRDTSRGIREDRGFDGVLPTGDLFLDNEIVQHALWSTEHLANAKMSLRLVRECLAPHRLGGAQ